MEQAAQSKPEQQFGDTVIAGEEADWRTVSQLSESVLTRSKDLRAAVLLARAQTRLQQIEGLSQGLALIHQLVSRYWDTLHPDLDREDNDDPVMFLKIETAKQGAIKGESQDGAHKNEIDVVGWSWGMQAHTSLGAAGNAPKATVSELDILKRVDSASTALMRGVPRCGRRPIA